MCNDDLSHVDLHAPAGDHFYDRRNPVNNIDPKSGADENFVVIFEILPTDKE